MGKKPQPTKIDLACGAHAREGFFGVDIAAPEADMQMDVLQYPWPWADGSVEALHSSHFVEHIPMVKPFMDDELCAFMNEAYRCLRKPSGEPGEEGYVTGGTFTIIHPYAMSTRAFQDPTHRRFIPEATWYYFDKNWRESQGLGHYPITADFEVVVINALGLAPGYESRNAETQMFQRTHYWHIISDLQIELRAR